MINLKDRYSITLEVGTIATLLSGLYCTYCAVDPIAIPTSVYIELAEKLIPYLENWDYDKISFEDWVKYNLLIIPKVMVTEELEDLQKNAIYFERVNGNAVLVVTAEVV